MLWKMDEVWCNQECKGTWREQCNTQVWLKGLIRPNQLLFIYLALSKFALFFSIFSTPVSLGTGFKDSCCYFLPLCIQWEDGGSLGVAFNHQLVRVWYPSIMPNDELVDEETMFFFFGWNRGSFKHVVGLIIWIDGKEDVKDNLWTFPNTPFWKTLFWNSAGSQRFLW